MRGAKCFKMEQNGRGKRIRTSGPCLPKTVLYQAELFPDRCLKRAEARKAGGAYRRAFPAFQA